MWSGVASGYLDASVELRIVDDPEYISALVPHSSRSVGQSAPWQVTLCDSSTSPCWISLITYTVAVWDRRHPC